MADGNPAHQHGINPYRCQGCGTLRRLASAAARKRHACQDCAGVTSWERVDDPDVDVGGTRSSDLVDSIAESGGYNLGDQDPRGDGDV